MEIFGTPVMHLTFGVYRSWFTGCPCQELL